MILIATGMKREAKRLARDGVSVVVGGGDERRLEAELEAGIAAGASAILSMGLAGGLAPLLAPGDWVVGTLSPTGMERREWSVGVGKTRPPERRADPRPTARKEASREWINRLAGLLPGAVVGRIHANGAMIVTAKQKEDLHFTTRALACDMESHVAARVAERHHLPFAVARVIADTADRDLPLAARVAMRPDGGISGGAMALALARKPWEIPALIALAIDSGRAMKALLRGYDMLAGGGFGLADARQFPLDMG